MISSWDQLNFGGYPIRFHSETFNGKVTVQWECDDPDNCDACREYNEEQSS